MRTQSTDTSPDAERILIEGYRRMPATMKLQCLEALTEFARSLQRADILRRHPGIGETELRLRLASRWLGPELMRRAFNWDPDEQGY